MTSSTSPGASASWSSGHHEPIPRVNTSKAFATPHLTCTVFTTGATVIVSLISFAPFCRRLEADQRFVPESVEPEPEHREPVRLDRVEVPRAALGAGDEACAFEHLQMLRDRGPAH